MIKTTLSALTLTSLLILASGPALAGATGPTDPVDGPAKTPAAGMEKNTDGTTPAAKGTSPGTKGMDPEPKSDHGSTGTGTEKGAGGNKSGAADSSTGG